MIKNIFAIPLAAGILAPWGFVLSPAFGAILMSVSIVIVAIGDQRRRIVDTVTDHGVMTLR